MSFDVFISYSTKDAIVAKAACAALESAKIRCWMAPRDIVPGAKWGASIVRAINECRVMVLIFSGNANDSSQVQREVDQAFSKAKTVVPLRIEDIKPADELAYYLDTVHWLDALTPPLERNLEKLVATVQALLPTTEQPSPSSEPAIDEAQAAKAQDEARAEDERRLKEAEAAESAEVARREQEAADAARRQQEAEAQRVSAEQRQKDEEKRRADEAARREREQAEANERAEQERRAREAEAKERTEQEQAFAKAKSADTVAALDAFLAAYPASHLAAESARLRAALAERDEAYRAAVASNNAVAFKTFLERYPKSKLVSDVRKRLRRLERPRGNLPLLIGGGGLGIAVIAILAIMLKPSAPQQTFTAAPKPSSILNFDLPTACMSYQPTRRTDAKKLVFLVEHESQYETAEQQARSLGDQHGWSTVRVLKFRSGITDFSWALAHISNDNPGAIIYCGSYSSELLKQARQFGLF